MRDKLWSIILAFISSVKGQSLFFGEEQWIPQDWDDLNEKWKNVPQNGLDSENCPSEADQ